MKNLVLSLMVLGVSSISQADGFNCQTVEGDLSLLIRNHARPEAGTRKGAVMVLTDLLSEDETRTIIRFYGDSGRLTNKGSHYVGHVGPRFRTAYPDHPFSGTGTSELLQIVADIDFSYDAPVANGEEVSGTLTLVKDAGGEIVRDLSCTRYLKN